MLKKITVGGCLIYHYQTLQHCYHTQHSCHNNLSEAMTTDILMNIETVQAAKNISFILVTLHSVASSILLK